MYTPLTREQYEKARTKFSDQQIIQMEQRRKSEAAGSDTTASDDPRSGLVQESRPKDGFLKSLVKKPIEALVVRPAARVAQAGIAAFGGEKGRQFAEKNVDINVPVLGDFNVGKVKPGMAGVKQVAGEAAETASYLAPTGGTATTALGRVGKSSLAGAGSGFLAASGEALKENKSLKGTAVAGLKGAVTGAVTSGAISGLGEVAKGTSSVLKESAKGTYTKALAPTTKLNKEKAAKIVPELIDRKVFSFTRKGLLDKAGKAVDSAGEALEDGYAALPKESRISLLPTLKALEEKKGEAIVNGVVLDKGKYKALETVQQDLLRVAGGTAKESPTNPVLSVESARRARQILDGITERSGKSFALNATENAAITANKEGANAIRRELAAEFPSIAKLNKEFNFWKNLQDVLGSTIERTRGQNPLGETIAEGAGAAAGATLSGTFGGVLATAVGLKVLKQAFQSAGWRTASAITKDRLANAIAAGDNKAVIDILKRLTTPTSASTAGN